MTAITLDQLNALKRQVLLAGELLMDFREKENLEVTFKEDQSPVTRADLEASRLLENFLAGEYPGVYLISEEAEHEGGTERLWLVDPLDGTKEYVDGRGDFTVNVGLIDQGLPVAGIVYAPALKLLVASKGPGHLLVEGALPRVAQNNNSEIRIAISRSHLDAETERFCAALGSESLIELGSSLKFISLLGDVDLYPRFGTTMEWDTAASHAILRNNGGEVVDASGETLRYGKRDLRNPHFLAYSPRVKDELVGPALAIWRASRHLKS